MSTGSSAPPHRIVCLEGCHCALPKYDFSYGYTEYDNTKPDQVRERIRDATIVITTIVPVRPEDAEQCPNLRLVAIMATGAGWVQKEYFARRGITVINCPGSNIPAVSEHAIGLYFACRKRIVEMHERTTRTDEWMERGTLTKRFDAAPPSCGQEVIGIVGYGALGKRIEMLCRGIGMGEVTISERRGVREARPGRVAFEQVLKTASVLIVCCPKDPSTINLIDEQELKTMRSDACLINMARGGIVNEAALAKALLGKWISSAATDVLEVEPPVRSESPLLRVELPTLTVSPHISWFAARTIELLQKLLKDGIEAFVAGRPINVVVPA